MNAVVYLDFGRSDCYMAVVYSGLGQGSLWRPNTIWDTQWTPLWSECPVLLLFSSHVRQIRTSIVCTVEEVSLPVYSNLKFGDHLGR
jgi:hypothetical protein